MYYSLIFVNFQAQILGMKYPKYIYLMYGTYESQWWTIEDEVLTGLDLELNCSPEDRVEVLEFSLAALHISSSDSGAVRFQFGFTEENSFIITCKFLQECELQNLFYYQCFDAVFAVALALNKTFGGNQLLVVNVWLLYYTPSLLSQN